MCEREALINGLILVVSRHGSKQFWYVYNSRYVTYQAFASPYQDKLRIR